MANIYKGNTETFIAPVGGVVFNQPYVIQNTFVVSKQTKAAGQPFTGVVRNVTVTLPYYHGTVYRGQHACWWNSAGVVTDFEGDNIGHFMGDYTAADATCDVYLTGQTVPRDEHRAAPLGPGGLPDEISVTMVAGSGTAAVTLPDWVEVFEGDITTNGNWNVNGTITLTFTRPGTHSTEMWGREIISGVQRQTAVNVTTNTITVIMTNTSGGVVGAGSRITRGIIKRIAKREV